MRRVLLSVTLAIATVVMGFAVIPEPEAAGVGAGDVIGEYALKLKGNGFDRHATSGAVDQAKVRGSARLTIVRANDTADPRLVRISIVLDKNLRKSVLDRATPSPAALEGVGILVDDSLTVIGAGQANFVNAVTLRFLRKGRKVDGFWMASFPGSDVDDGFVAGVGVALKGKRLRVQPAAVSADAARAR